MPACRSCGAPILWARTVQGKAIPLDAQRSERGNIELRGGTAHYVTPDINAELRYISHFATCPQADQHRKPKA